MQLEIDEGTIHAGSIVRGRVADMSTQLVNVMLTAYEPTQVFPATAVQTQIGPGGDYRFELQVPATAAEFTVMGFEVTWGVRAKVPYPAPGGTFAEIVIEPVDPADRIAVPDAEIERIAEANDRKHGEIGNGEILATAMFFLMGLGLLGVGVFTAIWPPASFGDTTTPAYVMMAMSVCFFLPGYLRVRSLYRPSPMRGVTVVSHSRSAHRGETVDITLSLEPGRSVRVGFVTTLGLFGQLRSMTGHRHRPGGGFTFRTMFDSWQDVDSSNPTVTFTVPADSAPTYTGQSMLIMHHLRVQPAGSTSTKWNTRRLEVPVVVLP